MKGNDLLYDGPTTWGLMSILQGLQRVKIPVETKAKGPAPVVETLAAWVGALGSENRESSSASVPESNRLAYANDLAIASNGDIYFSDSAVVPPAVGSKGFADTARAFFLIAMEGKPTGRLLVWRAATKTTEVVAEGLWYANGVALSTDESYAIVCETLPRRVVKVWLNGPKVGLLMRAVQISQAVWRHIDLNECENQWA